MSSKADLRKVLVACLSALLFEAQFLGDVLSSPFHLNIPDDASRYNDLAVQLIVCIFQRSPGSGHMVISCDLSTFCLIQKRQTCASVRAVPKLKAVVGLSLIQASSNLCAKQTCRELDLFHKLSKYTT